ncbi:MAG: hypothetical protein AB7H90_13070 [Alphaproteobacteria bacterium]
MKGQLHKARYDAAYFQGFDKSNYGDYISNVSDRSRMLTDTLFNLFRPGISLDMRCAAVYTVNHFRELGMESYGYDWSEWAIERVGVLCISAFDVAMTLLDSTYQFNHSNDAIEYVPESRLEFADWNSWVACERYLGTAPTLYPKDTTLDPTDKNHETPPLHKWRYNFFTKDCGYEFNYQISARLAGAEHLRIFNYITYISIFGKPQRPTVAR